MARASLAAYLGALCAFAALARAGHDLWAATLLHLGALGAALWLLADARVKESPGVPKAPLVPMAALCAALAASTAGSANPSESLHALRDVLAALLLFWAACRAMAREEALDAFLSLMAALCWIELGMILWQHYDTHFNAAVPKELQHPGVPAWRLLLSYQVPATLVNSNAAAAFHLLLFPPLARRAFGGLRGGKALFWTAALAADVLNLFLLKSTAALLCLAAGAALLPGPGALKSFVLRRPRLSAALGAAVLMSCGGAAAWKLLHSVDFTGARLEEGETLRRLSWWAAGWGMFRDHPWLGVGLGNFPSAFPAYRPGPMQNTRFAHSFLVTLVSETGLAGLLAAAFAAGWFLRRLRALPRLVEERWPYLLGPLLFLGFSSINIGIEYLANLLLLAVLLGAALAPAETAGLRTGRMTLAVATALSLAAASFLLATLQASRLCVRGSELLAEGDEEGALKVFLDAASLDGLSWEAQAGAARALEARYRRRGDSRSLEEASAHLRR